MSTRIVFRMGKRIYLSPLSKDDLLFLTVSINDPEISQFLAVSFPMTKDDEEKWLESVGNRKPQNIVLAMRLVENDEIIGATGLHDIDFLDRTAVSGSYIGKKDLWGKGYGTEAKMLLLEYAFNTLNLYKVKSAVHDFNVRSMNCLKVCGYKLQGIFEGEKWRNGRRTDSHQFAVFYDDFLKLWKIYHEKYLK